MRDQVATAARALEEAHPRWGSEGFWRENPALAEKEYRQPGIVWQLPYGRR